MIKIINCEQGSPEWFQARLGIPTASEFATVMRTKGKGENGESKERRTYLHKLAGEIITGQPMESYTNAYMERGKELEDEARKLYAFQTDTDPQIVGFIRNGDAGASPDSLIGNDGGMEIKTALPHIQIERLLRGELPPEHRAQVQGNIWICERDWWDFMSYCPKLPPFILRVPRDDDYIASLAAAVAAFNHDLAETVARIRTYGMRAAA